MRMLWVALLVSLTLGAAAGCDSGSDGGPADAEVFVGNWRLTSLLLNGQNFTALLLANATVTIDFDNAAFIVTVTTDTTTTIAGTYSLDEARKRVTLTSSSLSNPVTLDYEINNNNQITLETDDIALFTGLTGINPSDLGIVVETIGLVVQRQASFHPF